jgi:hypothetical protein
LPGCANSIDPNKTPEEEFTTRSILLLKKLPKLVLFDCLLAEVKLAIEENSWWEPMLVTAWTVEGRWPCVISLRKSYKPTSRPALAH